MVKKCKNEYRRMQTYFAENVNFFENGIRKQRRNNNDLFVVGDSW